MNELIQSLATLLAGLFAGAAVYINVAEHPARVECGSALAATVFGPSYRRAAAMQASLAVLGSLAGMLAWLGSGESAWMWGALALFSVVPFTLLAIMPTNRRLLDPTREPDSPETAALLDRWGRLHAVRSAAGLLSFVLFVLAGRG